MHFPYSMSVKEGQAEVLVYDGPDSRGNLLTTISVKNETFPQSVTSTRDTIYLEFKASAGHRMLFYVDLVAGKGTFSFLMANPELSELILNQIPDDPNLSFH